MKKSVSIKMLGIILTMPLILLNSHKAFSIGDNTQAEYASFEETGSTDMVNLISGDFTYTIPLLYVPSPEGGFSLPLSYHAGIRLDQEASWVGLGWSLNAGALTRSISQFPDDSKGGVLSTHVADPGGSGYNINYVLWSKCWDSKKGSGGTIGLGSLLSIGFGTKAGFTALGVTFDDKGVHADPIGVALSIATIATAGSTSILTSAFGETGTAIGTVLDIAQATYGLMSMAVAIGNAKMVNYNDWKYEVHTGVFKQSYKYWLDATKDENMFGSLYLGDYSFCLTNCGNADALDCGNNGTGTHTVGWASTVETVCDYFDRTFMGGNCDNQHYEVAHDMVMHVEGSSMANNDAPTNIAYDSYQVMGTGVSGGIAPYRLDVGSLAYPKKGDSFNRRFALTEFQKTFAVDNTQDIRINRTNFRYLNEPANYYLWHLTTSAPVTGDIPTSAFPYGLELITNSNPTSLQFYSFNIDDPVAYRGGNYRYDPRLPSQGISNEHLVTGKVVNWFTNKEILDDIHGVISSHHEFIDFLPSAERTTFRSQEPDVGIGGFSITRPDGYTFYYALPVYQRAQFSKAYSSSTIYNSSTMNDWFATTWLLTAITGPDFVDRGEIGYIDNDDWGTWVKFEYGKFSSYYHSRSPYNYDLMPATPGSRQFMETLRESYYLDKIVTRTHTAIFVKDLRTDGKGAYGGTNIAISGFNDTYAAANLKLNRILLFKNEDYQYLVNNGFTKSSGNQSNLLSHPGDSFDEVIDEYDFSGLPLSLIDYIKNNQLKKIVFNYAPPGSSTELCKNTPNSFSYSTPSDKKGKLTLLGVSTYEKADVKLIPDYLFEYGSNPDYGNFKWDAWGYYCSVGTDYPENEHKATVLDGLAWSMNKITTSVGSEISIQYARDRYSSISGNPLDMHILASCSYDNVNNTLTFNYPAHFLLNYVVNFSTPPSQLPLIIRKYSNSGGTACTESHVDENITVDVSSIMYYASFATVDIASTINITNLGNGHCPPSTDPPYELLLDIGKLVEAKYGGDLSVYQIKTKDKDISNDEYITTYIYTPKGDLSYSTSGVCSVEPEFSRIREYSFYDYYDYPMTPILYGKVNVYKGPFTNPNDFLGRTEYTFKTPSYDMVSVDQVAEQGGIRTLDDGSSFHQYKFCVKVKTDQIGRLESIKSFNERNELITQTSYDYANQGDFTYFNYPIGTYTEGSILSDQVRDQPTSPSTVHLNRTTKLYIPNILKSVTINEKGITKIMTNKEYDPVTGSVLETEYQNSDGQKFVSKTVPAYVAYPRMGSKVLDPEYKNMLKQEAAEYLFAERNTDLKLVNASVTTWNDLWNYRVLNPATNLYENQFVGSPDNYARVWRKRSTYSWRSLIDNDGTVPLSGFEKFEVGTDEFDFSSSATNNSHWIKTSEITGYDKHSHALGGRNYLSNKYVSSKVGYNESFIIATIDNAKYDEFAYSGAEDPVPNTNYFGGEISADPNTRTSIRSHTGNYSLRLGSGQAGFYYSGSVNVSAATFTVGRNYRVSVWLHDSNVQHGVLKCIFKDSGNNILGDINAKVGSTDPRVKSFCAGHWCLLTVDIDRGDNIYAAVYNYPVVKFEFKVLNDDPGTSYAYFDDFRIQPTDATMAAYVYDEKTGLITAVLDNENIATKYFYDFGGRLISIQKETENGFKTTQQTTYHYSGQ